MFSSSSTNRDLSFPPPPLPHPFLDHDGQDTFSQYCNIDLLTSDFLLANYPFTDPISPSSTPTMTGVVSTTLSRTNQVTDHQKLGLSRSMKKRGKTDRHSKICTAQGPRDRRVRLSIGIARSFFDLQDLLGFDKASKTIDWLLNNSKEAIKELRECSFEEGEDHKLKKAASSCPARESRARARARARERTIGKLSSKDSDCTILMKSPICKLDLQNCDLNWEVSGSNSCPSYLAMTGMNLSPGAHF